MYDEIENVVADCLDGKISEEERDAEIELLEVELSKLGIKELTEAEMKQKKIKTKSSKSNVSTFAVVPGSNSNTKFYKSYDNNTAALNYYLGKTSVYKYYVNNVYMSSFGSSSKVKLYPSTPSFPSQIS